MGLIAMRSKSHFFGGCFVVVVVFVIIIVVLYLSFVAVNIGFMCGQ